MKMSEPSEVQESLREYVRLHEVLRERVQDLRNEAKNALKAARDLNRIQDHLVFKLGFDPEVEFSLDSFKEELLIPRVKRLNRRELEMLLDRYKDDYEELGGEV